MPDWTLTASPTGRWSGSAALLLEGRGAGRPLAHRCDTDYLRRQHRARLWGRCSFGLSRGDWDRGPFGLHGQQRNRPARRDRRVRGRLFPHRRRQHHRALTGKEQTLRSRFRVTAIG
jgi:hypothetical protein